MTVPIRPVIAVVLLYCSNFARVPLAPEYLGNNQRSGYTNATVPTKPVLLWTYHERHAPKTAWPEPFGELQFIDFDYSDQVTIGGQLVYFGSSADHTVRALDAGNGEERWVFYTEGPVRFAPVLHRDRLYVVSDDGHLYCLKASDGCLIWQRRLAPGSQRCLGNGQMVSKWPCRSGVLIEGDKLYTTAGMWSADGVIIYCLNAETGKLIWKNDTTGHRWMLLPHGSGYGGVAPQDYLALYKDTLYVAAGRFAPAIFDAKTGKLLFHEIGLGYKALFDVLVNGNKVLSQLDIVREAGAPRRALAKEVTGIGPCNTVELSLKPVSGKTAADLRCRDYSGVKTCWIATIYLNGMPRQ